jgi:histone H3/H4
VLGPAIYIARRAGRRRISSEDVANAIQELYCDAGDGGGVPPFLARIAFNDYDLRELKRLPRCGAYRSQGVDEEEPATRSGRARSRVAFYRRGASFSGSGCLVASRGAFGALARAALATWPASDVAGMGLGGGALALLQLVTEESLVRVLSAARRVAGAAGRKSVRPGDVDDADAIASRAA